MKLSGIIWLEEIVEKIEHKHRVTQEEVREILNGSSHFRFVEKGAPTRRKRLFGIGPDQSRPVSVRVLRAQEDGASVADIGAKHDPR